MSLKDDLSVLSGSVGCKVGNWLHSLDEDSREAAVAAINGGAGHVDLAAVFKKHGYAGSADLLGRHRRKDCACVSRG